MNQSGVLTPAILLYGPPPLPLGPARWQQVGWPQSVGKANDRLAKSSELSTRNLNPSSVAAAAFFAKVQRQELEADVLEAHEALQQQGFELLSKAQQAMQLREFLEQLMEAEEEEAAERLYVTKEAEVEMASLRRMHKDTQSEWRCTEVWLSMCFRVSMLR